MIIARALENIYIIPAFRAACRFCTWFQRFNARDTRDAFHYMNSGRAFKSLTNAVSYIFLFIFIFIIFWIREIFRTFTNVIYVIFPQAKARFPRFSFHATWRSIDVIIKIKGWYTYPDRMVYLARLGEIVAPRVCVYMNVCICICVCISITFPNTKTVFTDHMYTIRRQWAKRREEIDFLAWKWSCITSQCIHPRPRVQQHWPAVTRGERTR